MARIVDGAFCLAPHPLEMVTLPPCIHANKGGRFQDRFGMALVQRMLLPVRERATLATLSITRAFSLKDGHHWEWFVGHQSPRNI